jgi:hypothetical protein
MIKQAHGVTRVTTQSPRASAIMLLLFAAGILLIGAAFYDRPVMWGVAASGSACFIAGLLMFFVFKFDKLVAEISEEGITERVSKASGGLIRWEEIEAVYAYETIGTNSLVPADHLDGRADLFVGIFLKDPDAYMRKLNKIQKGIMKL